jgi:hypothetical protein
VLAGYSGPVRRWNLPSGDGVSLAVPGPVVPELRLEVAAGRRMLLRQRDRVVLLATVDVAHYGVSVYRTGRYTSPLPPVRADEARRMPPVGADGWSVRWAHRVAGWLAAPQAGPLHAGRWLLRSATLPAYCLDADLVRDYPVAYLDWLGAGWNGVVPLRRLPEEDTGRVRAYRKLAAEGLLPPVVLWWISGLDGYLLLDGHARLVAAHAEGVAPPVLLLGMAERPESQRVWLAQLTAGYETAMAQVARQVRAGRSGAQRAVDRVGARFAAQVADLTTGTARTVAWPLRGGGRAWSHTAVTEAPAWADAVDRAGPSGGHQTEPGAECFSGRE